MYGHKLTVHSSYEYTAAASAVAQPALRVQPAASHDA
jgi:hypothetical protein